MTHIFRNSSIMARSEARDFGESAIVGDSGYPSKQHLMTPLVQTRTEAENLYNDSQIRTRNVVERSYGEAISRPSIRD
jgi:hypothetical protein